MLDLWPAHALANVTGSRAPNGLDTNRAHKHSPARKYASTNALPARNTHARRIALALVERYRACVLWRVCVHATLIECMPFITFQLFGSILIVCHFISVYAN